MPRRVGNSLQSKRTPRMHMSTIKSGRSHIVYTKKTLGISREGGGGILFSLLKVLYVYFCAKKKKKYSSEYNQKSWVLRMKKRCKWHRWVFCADIGAPDEHWSRFFIFYNFLLLVIIGFYQSVQDISKGNDTSDKICNDFGLPFWFFFWMK